jgi:PAT family beta-lactamase induction signal transducer AmpG
MFGTQISLMIAIASLAFTQPAVHLSTIAVLCLLVAFFSASQDIVLDAYRRESLSDEELGIGSSMFIYGYRMGMLAAGALALFLADQESLSWNAVYFIMGTMMVIGILTTWFAPEPNIPAPPPASWQEAIMGPFMDFFSRPGSHTILLFILLYKVGDSMASEMLSPFMVDLGVSKTDYAVIVKAFGMIALIVGGLIGGLVVYRLGIVPSLLILGFLQMISTAGFVILAFTGNHLPTLTAVIAFETISSGLGQTAFVAYMASLTNKRFTATQYALLTSFMGIPRVFAGSTTGFLATWLGWEGFFILCTLLALPGLLLIGQLRRLAHNPTTQAVTTRA